LKSAAGQISQ